MIGERSEEDRADILAEVERLRGIYGSNPSFSRYAGELLAAVRVMAGTVPDQAPVTPERGDELPHDLRVDLGRVVAGTATLSGEWLLAWLVSDHGGRARRWRSASPRSSARCFCAGSLVIFPMGSRLRCRSGSSPPRYRAASGSFEVSLLAESDVVPDVTALRAPLDKGNGIAARCAADIDSLSRFLGKFPERRESLDAYLLLPADLRDIEPAAVPPGLYADLLRRMAESLVSRLFLVPMAQ